MNCEQMQGFERSIVCVSFTARHCPVFNLKNLKKTIKKCHCGMTH